MYIQSMHDAKLLSIWKQSQTALIFRRDEGELMVKMPYGDDNRKWLHEGRRSKPTWNLQHKCWHLPRSCFSELSERFLQRFGTLYIIQPFHPEEKCSTACQHAKCLECECSCLGKNHGRGLAMEDRWYSMLDSVAAQWDEKWYRWSLLRRVESLSEAAAAMRA